MTSATNDKAKSADISRSRLAMLRARYDDGAVSPAIYSVIRQLETEIAWYEHRQDPGGHGK
jgi:hypothetical protein